MPDKANSGSTAAVQQLLEKPCPECGAKVFGRTLHKQYCEACKASRHKDTQLRAAEKQRRKNGIPKVKGEEFPCQECSQSFVATSKSRAKYCVECRAIVSLRASNDSSRRRVSDPVRRDRYNEWVRDRVSDDPVYALSRMMRTLMHRELGRKTERRGSWDRVVGYSAKELREHLERQFLPGMTWENRGSGWHVDHIVPIAAFNYDSHMHPDFKACWSLTNLRPLWASDNVRKSDKRLYLI